MSFFAAAGFTIFILVLFAGIFLNLFGLPGTVVIFFDVVFYCFFTGFDRAGLKIILFLFISAIIAEAIDFFVVRGEIPQPRVSKKSFGSAALGALMGTFLLTSFFGGPGIWIGFFSGGLAGILTLEIIRQSKLKAPYRALNRAIFTMAGKKIIKGFISLCMIAFSLSNIYS
ncbi:MAG TPA: DUF456 family protein [Smithella sp.]|nr:DUF456 family protein [Smithella sp.]